MFCRSRTDRARALPTSPPNLRPRGSPRARPPESGFRRGLGFGAAERWQVVEIDTGVEFGVAVPFVPRALEVGGNVILEGDEGSCKCPEVLGVPDTLGELFPHPGVSLRRSWRWGLRSARRWKLAMASLRCSFHLMASGATRQCDRRRRDFLAGSGAMERWVVGRRLFVGSPIPKFFAAGEIGGADDNGDFTLRPLRVLPLCESFPRLPLFLLDFLAASVQP
jgi:hypothetical protein